MKEQVAAPTRSLGSEQIRVKLNRLRRSSQSGMFGVAEIAALAGSVLLLVLVAVSYLYFLVPARSRLQSLQLERTRLQAQLRSSNDIVQKGKSTEVTVQEIKDSLDAFENQRLPDRTQGRMDLYSVLNDLIRKDGLRNTAGPTYAPLDSLGTKTGAGSAKSTSTKWQTVYPGIAINLTVEGPYQNLRRFVHDVEASKEFIIIHAVELERATETNSSESTEAGSSSGSRNSLVSLRLDMATYFRRAGENSNPAEPTEH